MAGETLAVQGSRSLVDIDWSSYRKTVQAEHQKVRLFKCWSSSSVAMALTNIEVPKQTMDAQA